MTNNVTENDPREQLKEKLREIFQVENEDLDFGIYRIMNYKRQEIEDFIENKLIKEIESQLISIGEGIKSDELERDIYNHLINFFSRYYDRGDFISKRRYGSRERYCIPYNGEEVLLYWVNKDQYYIKTTEYFRKYTFKVKDLTVNFKVVEAEEEKGNVKSLERKFFILSEPPFEFDEEKRELNIYFEYRGLTEEEAKKYRYDSSRVQDMINQETIKVLRQQIPEGSLARVVLEKDPRSNTQSSYIRKHLHRYTRRNTTDYFIHKNLKEFLERELDFYIKNELLRLEDLQVLEQCSYFDKLRLYLIETRVFRKVAQRIIEFLAQIEDFQRKIWEKKKFIIDTHYVITLNRVKEYAGEEFLEGVLDDILNNEKQLSEWKELLGVEVKGREDLIERTTLHGNSWKSLPIDTRYFDEEFKLKLLNALSERNDLEDILDGVLIKSENWQALNLLLNKYYGKVQTVYIDPPFNKEQEADYLYKVGYKDSTWLTMLENRISLAKDMLNERGSFFVNCDDNGNMYVRLLLDSILGKDRFKNEIIWCYEKPGGPTDRLKNNHSTIFFYAKSESSIFNQIYVPRKGEDELTKREGRYATDYAGKISPDWWIDIPSFATMMTAKERVVKSIGVNFTTQQPEKLIKRIVQMTSSNDRDIVMDFFLGSGTTLSVAHKLGRRWIGIEMGDHFWTVILPRMKRVLAYDESGISRDEDVKRTYNKETAGGFFKYHTLEQYEDALENIEFEKPEPTLYDLPDYFVKYMLEWETKGSRTFLNIREVKDPYNYRLKVIEDYQQREVRVDLIETFNYLLGLHVSKYRTVEDNGRRYIFIFGKKDSRKVAVVWRSLENISLERDKEVIEQNIKDFNPEDVYINGDALVKGFKPIEPTFKSLMFEGTP